MKMIRRRAFMGIFLVLGLLVGISLAQNSGEVQAQGEGKFELQVTKKDHETRISMDFKDADIRNVLRAISYQVGVNIIAGPEVSGNVTLRIVDAPWEEALSAMLKTYGYVYQWEDNIIRVTTLKICSQGKERCNILPRQILSS